MAWQEWVFYQVGLRSFQDGNGEIPVAGQLRPGPDEGMVVEEESSAQGPGCANVPRWTNSARGLRPVKPAAAARRRCSRSASSSG